MGTEAPGPDSEWLDELLFVERVRAHFRAAGVSLAYWEAFCLAQNNGPALRRAASRGTGSGVPHLPVEILENLRLLRDRGGPVVSKLRRLFLDKARPGEEADRLEMALGIVVGSERGREAVARWVEDPSRYAQEATDRLQGVMRRLEPLYRVLRPGPASAVEIRVAGADERTEGETLLAALRPLQGTALAPAEIMISPPGVPEDLRVACAAGVVQLSWKPVADSTGYNVKRATALGLPFLTIGTTPECRFTDGKVTPGSVYHYRISASNEAGEGDDSPPVQTATLPPVPRAPTGLKAVPGAGRIDLSWEVSPGSHEYAVKRGEGAGTPLSTIATVSSPIYSDVSVQAGASYGYAVSAIGPGGESPPSAGISAASLVPPSAPSGLEAIPGASRIVLRWKPVAGATGYVVRRAIGEGGILGPIGSPVSAEFQDTGLIKGGATYSYVVRATNAAGESTDSAPVVSAPVAAPRAPGEVEISAEGHKIRLTWKAAPGAAHYSVKRGTVAGGPYETILSGLRLLSQDDVPPVRGTKYYYVVNAAGPGGESAPSREVVGSLPVLPDPPRELRAAAGHGSVTLDWAPSSHATGYHVKRRIGPAARYVTLGNTAAPHFVDSTAVGGTRYEYAITAMNGGLESPPSGSVKAEPLSTPAAPSGLTAAPADHRVTLSWKPVAGAMEYRLQRATVREGLFSEIARLRGTTSHVDTAVTNGVAYDYVVVGVNSAGESPTSARARATPAAPPAAPRGLQSSASQGRVLLAWAAAADASEYVVKRADSPEGPFQEIASVLQTTYTDSAVTNGSSYYYKVSAANAGGRSEDSGPLGATPVDLPAEPTQVQAVAGPGLVSLSWGQQPDATSYLVKRSASADGPFTTLGTTGACSLVDRDVHPRTPYRYLVIAVNGAGRSAPSKIVNASPLPRE